MLDRSVGITDEQFADMADAATSPHFDATDKLVQRFAEVITRENRVHATFRTDVDESTEEALGDAPACPIGR